MFTAGLGELAAVATAFGWSVSGYAHSIVASSVGVASLTLMRMPLQLILLGFLSLCMGAIAPITPMALLQLCLSGILGISVGDMLFYRAITIIGPNLGILVQSLSAAMAALLGIAFLGEYLSWQIALGIALTTFGVGTVIAEGRGVMLPGQRQPNRRELLIGVSYALVSSFLLAASFIFFRAALLTGPTPIWATTVRIIFAGAALWLCGLIRRWPQKSISAFRGRPDMFRLLAGAALFSGLGIWMSGVALALAPAGVAAALIGLQPVMIMLLTSVIQRRRPSPIAVSGTFIAFGGTTLICLR